MQAFIDFMRDFAQGIMELFYLPPEKDKARDDDSLKRGKKFYQKRLLDFAIVSACESIRNHPEQRDAYILRGMCFLFKSDDHRAIEDFTQALNLSSQHTRIYFFRAVTYCELQNYDLAVADFDEALRLHQQFVEAHNDTAIESAFSNPFSLSGLGAEDLVLAYAYRGDAYAREENYIPAIADFTEVIHRDPLTADI